MEKIKLAVIFGGQSTEHNVSIVSGSSVLKNLNKEKYEIYPIYISKEGTWYHYNKNINEIYIFEIGKEPEEKYLECNKKIKRARRSISSTSWTMWRRRHNSRTFRAYKSTICWV